MSKNSIFLSLGLITVGGALSGVAYNTFNVFQEEDFLEIFKNLRKETESLIKKVKSKISGHASESSLKKLWDDFVFFTYVNICKNFSDNSNKSDLVKKFEDFGKTIETQKTSIKSSNPNDHKIEEFFLEMHNASSLISRIYKKMSSLKNQHSLVWKKLDDISTKISEKFKSKTENENFTKFQSLLRNIQEINAKILNKKLDFSDVVEESKNLDEEFLSKKKEINQEIESENLKVAKKELKNLVNVLLEQEKLVVLWNSLYDSVFYKLGSI